MKVKSTINSDQTLFGRRPEACTISKVSPKTKAFRNGFVQSADRPALANIQIFSWGISIRKLAQKR